MHILFNPRCEGLRELLFTHIQISDSSDGSRPVQAAELRRLLAECRRHKSNRGNLKTALRARKISKQRSPQKRTHKGMGR